MLFLPYKVLREGLTFMVLGDIFIYLFYFDLHKSEENINDIKMMIPDIKMILLINVLRSARPNTVL